MILPSVLQWKGLPAVHGRITLQLAPEIGKQKHPPVSLPFNNPSWAQGNFPSERLFRAVRPLTENVFLTSSYLLSSHPHSNISSESVQTPPPLWSLVGKARQWLPGIHSAVHILIRTALKWDPKHPFPPAFIARGRGSLSANYTSTQTSLMLWSWWKVVSFDETHTLYTLYFLSLQYH